MAASQVVSRAIWLRPSRSTVLDSITCARSRRRACSTRFSAWCTSPAARRSRPSASCSSVARRTTTGSPAVVSPSQTSTRRPRKPFRPGSSGVNAASALVQLVAGELQGLLPNADQVAAVGCVFEVDVVLTDAERRRGAGHPLLARQQAPRTGTSGLPPGSRTGVPRSLSGISRAYPEQCPVRTSPAAARSAPRSTPRVFNARATVPRSWSPTAATTCAPRSGDR